MRPGQRLALCLALGLAPLKAAALDCAKPVTTADMSACARAELDAADMALNLAWKAALAHAEELDTYLSEGEEKTADALLTAQRAWIDFRDKACFAEGLEYRGGTLQTTEVLYCLLRQTERRTQDLIYFGGEK